MRNTLHLSIGFILQLVLFSCNETQIVSAFPSEFYGLGMEIEIRNDKPLITFIHKDSPADKSKILIGDVIEAIDGQSTAKMTLAEVIMRIRGPENSQIILDLKRHNYDIILVLLRKKLQKGPIGYQPTNSRK